MSEVAVQPDAAAVAQAAAEVFTEACGGAVAARGQAVVALTGGSSATPLFAALRTDRWRARVPWGALHIFFTDERAVPPDDPLSNCGLARRELLDHVPVLPEHVHPLRGDAPSLAAEASRAAAELRAVAGTPPRFDLVLLGLGPDGHILSIFPGPSALDRGDDALVRPVAAPTHVEPHVARLTLTPYLVSTARTVLLQVVGAGKSAPLARALRGPEDVAACPAQWLRRAAGRVVVVTDGAAAADLQRPPQ